MSLTVPDRDTVKEAIDRARVCNDKAAIPIPPSVAATLIAAAQAWVEQGDAIIIRRDDLETATTAFDRLRAGGPSMEGRTHFHGSLSSDEYAAFQAMFDALSAEGDQP